MNANNADFQYDESGSSGSSFSIQDYISKLLRGKWIILISLGAFLFIMVIVTLSSKELYQASSSVLVNPRAGSSFSISDVNRPISDTKIANELGQLRSRMLAEAVARRLLQRPYLDPNRTVLSPVVMSTRPGGDTSKSLASISQISSRVQRAMDFIPERESDVIRIVARTTHPQEAANLANLYADVFQEHDLSFSRSRSKSLREFLQNQMGMKQHTLDSSENSLRGYMQSSGVVSLDAQAERVTQQLSQLEANRDAIDIDIESLTKTLATYQQRLPEQEKEVGRVLKQANDPYIKLIQEQLANLQVQRDVLANQNLTGMGQEVYAEKLKSIESQISNLQKKLDDRTVSYLQTIPMGELGAAQSDPASYLSQAKQKIFETQMQIQALAAKKNALNNVIRQYDADFSAIPRKSIELAKLQRSRLSAEKLYLLVEQKFNEAAIGEKSDFGYIDIIDTAVVNTSPVSPNFLFNMLLGIFMGLGVGIAIVFVKDFVDVRINTPEDLRRHGFQLLSYVARMGGRKASVPSAVRAKLNGRDYPLTLISLLQPFSPEAEAFRRLRTKLEHLLPEDRTRKVVFTSPNPGEGKTTTVANLGVALAQAERHVLVIDGDLRRPTLNTLFGFELKPGLNDVLTGKASMKQAVHTDAIPGLDVLCSGEISTHDPEIMGSKHMQRLLSELDEEYDWVLIDCSPALAVSDAGILSSMTDGAVMVASGGETRVVALERASEFLLGAGGKLIGVFLNKFDAREAYGGFYGSEKYGHYSTAYGKPVHPATWVEKAPVPPVQRLKKLLQH